MEEKAPNFQLLLLVHLRPSAGSTDRPLTGVRRAQEVLREVFAKFDEDGGGSIDEEELGHAMRALGAAVSASELTALVEEIDASRRRFLDFSRRPASLTLRYRALAGGRQRRD